MVLLLQITWEERRRRQERRGLMRILHAELRHNEREMALLQGPHVRGHYEKAEALHDDAWKSTRARLAQLVGAKTIAPLISYYLVLQTLKHFAGYRRGDAPNSKEELGNLIDATRAQEEETYAALERYIGSEHPGWIELLGRKRSGSE